MIGVAIIYFREILEVALVFTILLAATRGILGRARVVWAGVGLGVLASGVVAFFADAISSAAEGMGQEILNASVLFLATALITWHIVWMNSHGKEMANQIKAVGESVRKGEKPHYMIAVVMAIAVFREGAEIILFSYGSVAQGTAIWEVVIGGLIGLTLGVLAGALFYFGLLKISLKHIFGVTSSILIFLAAGMVSQAVGYLSAAGWIPELVSPLWDSSRVLSEQSLVGKILHSLLGYSDRPSGSQVIAYGITIGVIVMLIKKLGREARVVMVGLVVLAGLGWSSSVWAFPKVYSPIIEKGEWEIEAQGYVTFDDRDTKDNKQDQRYALGYGPTDWWFTEFYGIFKKPAQSDFEFKEIEWENRFMPFEPGQYWIDLGFYFAYEFGMDNDEPGADKVEMKLLLEKQFDEVVHDINLILEKEINGDTGVEEEGWEGGISYSMRYRWKPEFEPGFEVHYESGVFEESLPFEEQEFLLGPVVYGKIGPFKYDIGYLFGVTDESPEGELKWILEFEHRF